MTPEHREGLYTVTSMESIRSMPSQWLKMEGESGVGWEESGRCDGG